MSRHRGHHSTGGGRGRIRQDAERPVDASLCYEGPHPAVRALLNSIWAKRQHLESRSRDFIGDMRKRIESWPMTDRQLQWARSIGRSLGIGFDDPAFEPVQAASCVSAGARVLKVERWGALPATPPNARRVPES